MATFTEIVYEYTGVHDTFSYSSNGQHSKSSSDIISLDDEFTIEHGKIELFLSESVGFSDYAGAYDQYGINFYSQPSDMMRGDTFFVYPLRRKGPIQYDYSVNLYASYTGLWADRVLISSFMLFYNWTIPGGYLASPNYKLIMTPTDDESVRVFSDTFEIIGMEHTYAFTMEAGVIDSIEIITNTHFSINVEDEIILDEDPPHFEHRGIAILTPSGGEEFIKGQQAYISWSESGSTVIVNVYYSEDDNPEGSGSWNLVTLYNYQGYTYWTIPTGALVGPDYRIKIEDSLNNSVVATSVLFSVLGASHVYYALMTASVDDNFSYNHGWFFDINDEVDLSDDPSYVQRSHFTKTASDLMLVTDNVEIARNARISLVVPNENTQIDEDVTYTHRIMQRTSINDSVLFSEGMSAGLSSHYDRDSVDWVGVSDSSEIIYRTMQRLIFTENITFNEALLYGWTTPIEKQASTVASVEDSFSYEHKIMPRKIASDSMYCTDEFVLRRSQRFVSDFFDTTYINDGTPTSTLRVMERAIVSGDASVIDYISTFHAHHYTLPDIDDDMGVIDAFSYVRRIMQRKVVESDLGVEDDFSHVFKSQYRKEASDTAFIFDNFSRRISVHFTLEIADTVFMVEENTHEHKVQHRKFMSDLMTVFDSFDRITQSHHEPAPVPDQLIIIDLFTYNHGKAHGFSANEYIYLTQEAVMYRKSVRHQPDGAEDIMSIQDLLSFEVKLMHREETGDTLGVSDLVPVIDVRYMQRVSVSEIVGSVENVDERYPLLHHTETISDILGVSDSFTYSLKIMTRISVNEDIYFTESTQGRLSLHFNYSAGAEFLGTADSFSYVLRVMQRLNFGDATHFSENVEHRFISNYYYGAEDTALVSDTFTKVVRLMHRIEVGDTIRFEEEVNNRFSQRFLYVVPTSIIGVHDSPVIEYRNMERLTLNENVFFEDSLLVQQNHHLSRDASSYIGFSEFFESLLRIMNRITYVENVGFSELVTHYLSIHRVITLESEAVVEDEFTYNQGIQHSLSLSDTVGFQSTITYDHRVMQRLSLSDTSFLTGDITERVSQRVSIDISESVGFDGDTSYTLYSSVENYVTVEESILLTEEVAYVQRLAHRINVDESVTIGDEISNIKNFHHTLSVTDSVQFAVENITYHKSARIIRSASSELVVSDQFTYVLQLVIRLNVEETVYLVGDISAEIQDKFLVDVDELIGFNEDISSERKSGIQFNIGDSVGFQEYYYLFFDPITEIIIDIDEVIVIFDSQTVRGSRLHFIDIKDEVYLGYEVSNRYGGAVDLVVHKSLPFIPSGRSDWLIAINHHILIIDNVEITIMSMNAISYNIAYDTFGRFGDMGFKDAVSITKVKDMKGTSLLLDKDRLVKIYPSDTYTEKSSWIVTKSINIIKGVLKRYKITFDGIDGDIEARIKRIALSDVVDKLPSDKSNVWRWIKNDAGRGREFMFKLHNMKVIKKLIAYYISRVKGE